MATGVGSLAKWREAPAALLVAAVLSERGGGDGGGGGRDVKVGQECNQTLPPLLQAQAALP